MPSPFVIASRCAFLIALLAALAWAQDLIVSPPQPQVVPTSPDDAAPSSGVYVHDSALAMDRMALAQRLESLKEWGKSADVYQEIVEKYHDRVVPSHVDDSNTVDQYTSVLSLVNQRLQSWPPEGLAVYRARYELTAQNLLRAARDDNLAPLHEAFTRYFVTDAGKEAGLKLIDAYFERGDFPAAAWIGQALLLHPNLGGDKPNVLFRVGLAAHMSGDDASAQTAMDELKNHFPNAMATVGGHGVDLADELKSDLTHPAPAHTLLATGAGDDSWPMPGGEPSRGKVSFSAAQPDARLYSLPLVLPDWKGVADVNQRKTIQSQDQQWRDDGKDLGIIPVADRGELFFQDNVHIYAVNIETNDPLPGWVANDPSQKGRYTQTTIPNALAMPIGYQLSLTLTDTAVLAVMGLPHPLAVAYGQAANENDGAVVCVDRRTGRENWSFSVHDLADDSLRTLRFGGSPLVAGSNVYVGAFSNKGNGYEDCYVVCLDLASGKYRWSCYVNGAPDAGQTLQTPQGQIVSLLGVPTHLAYASGRVFVATDEGAVAAIDAYSGNIAWLNIYREPDEAVNPNTMPMMMRGWGGFRGGFGMPPQPGASWTPPPPWAANAPIVRDGDLFVLPADGRYILVYDAGDGHIIKKLRKSDCCLTQSDQGPDAAAASPDTLLGVLDGAAVYEGGKEKRQDLLMVATPSSVCALRWREYDPDHPSSAIQWVSAHDPGENLRGRPFVTADCVYVPTNLKLDQVAIRTGKTIQTYPAGAKPTGDSDSSSAWPTSEGPGNILAVGDYVVIAGDRNVCVYSSLNLARVKLDKEIAEAPSDPNARLHYAEVMFRANQPAIAAQRLDEAMKLLAAQDSPAAHDRAFNDAMEFAVKGGPGPVTDAIFDRADALARWPQQQVSYRITRARICRSQPRPDLATAIKLYQEILADNAMRTASARQDPVAPGNSFPSPAVDEITQAGIIAQAAIDLIIHKPQGAAAYLPFERAAQTEFNAALAAKDPRRLWAVAMDFPNSSVAQSAESSSAQIFEAQGKPREAAAVLRDLYSKITEPSQKPMVLAAMARNYLKTPDRLAAAAGRMAVAAQLDGDARLLQPMVAQGQTIPAGTTLTAAFNILAPLAESPPPRQVELPSFGMPSSAVEREYRKRYQHPPDPFAARQRKIDDVGKLLTAGDDFARYDQLATWTGGRGVSIYALADARLLGTDPDVIDEPRGVAWVDGAKDLLVWTGQDVLLVSGETGQTRWKLSLGVLPEVDLLAQDAPQANINLIQQMDLRLMGRARRQNLLPVRDRPFVVRSIPTADDANPAATSADESTSDAAGESVANVYPAAGMALLTTTTGRVAGVRLDDGSIQWQIRPSARAVDRLAANEDFTVIKTADESTAQLLVLDTSTGRFLARKLFNVQQDEEPVNFALADDGTLAYTTEDRILIHDLFDAAADPSLAHPKAIADAAPDKPFINMTRPDQLLIRGGTILALTEDGVMLRGYSAQTGQLREYTQDSHLAQMLLPTGEHTDEAQLAAGDKYIYTWGPSSIAAYNIEHPEEYWEPRDLDAPGTARQLLLGKDYLVLLSQPPDAAGQPSAWSMSAFSRSLVPGKETESGLRVYQQQLTDPQGIIAWQGIASGLCYLSGDHTLHLLQGNSNPAPPP